jgi:glutathione synthase
MEAAQHRGHRVLVTTAPQLTYSEGRVRATCRPALLRPAVLDEGRWITDPAWVTLGDAVDYRLDGADLVLMRIDPPVDADYVRATYLLDLVDPRSTLVVNSPAGLRTANEKLFGLAVADLMPPTLVTADVAAIRRTLAGWGRAVLKPTDCMAGRGILRLDPDDLNLPSILESATERGRRHVVVQQWIPGVERSGDRRVIVLDSVPIGALRRMAGPADFRCNMAAGASVQVDTVTSRDREICARLAPLLRRHGLHLVGLDVIADYLTEVNVTSPTGIREIDALSGTTLAHDVMAWAEAACPRGTGPADARTPRLQRSTSANQRRLT